MTTFSRPDVSWLGLLGVSVLGACQPQIDVNSALGSYGETFVDIDIAVGGQTSTRSAWRWSVDRHGAGSSGCGPSDAIHLVSGMEGLFFFFPSGPTAGTVGYGPTRFSTRVTNRLFLAGSTAPTYLVGGEWTLTSLGESSASLSSTDAELCTTLEEAGSVGGYVPSGCSAAGSVSLTAAWTAGAPLDWLMSLGPPSCESGEAFHVDADPPLCTIRTFSCDELDVLDE